MSLESWIDFFNISLYGTTVYTMQLWHFVQIFKRFQICSALCGFPVLPGSNYTTSFHWKGKKRPFETMRKSAVYQKAFSELGDSENITKELEETMESFVCSIYGSGKITSVNKLRCNKLVKKSNKLRSSDPSSLPPCKDTLRQKLKRNHVSNIWKQAIENSMVL